MCKTSFFRKLYFPKSASAITNPRRAISITRRELFDSHYCSRHVIPPRSSLKVEAFGGMLFGKLEVFFSPRNYCISLRAESFLNYHSLLRKWIFAPSLLRENFDARNRAEVSSNTPNQLFQKKKKTGNYNSWLFNFSFSERALFNRGAYSFIQMTPVCLPTL